MNRGTERAENEAEKWAKEWPDRFENWAKE